MSEALLLDTQIALWLDRGDERLRTGTRYMIDQSWQKGDTVLLSAVTAWQLAAQVDSGMLDLDLPVEAWLARFADRPGIAIVPLDHVTASRAYQLHHLELAELEQRLLIATAIARNATLVTYDDRILGVAQKYGRRYGFAASA